MSLIVCGNRTDSKSIWCYSDASTLAWSYDTGGHVYAITQDAGGNIYAVGVTSDSKNLWKLDSDGNLLGSYNVGDVGGYDQKAVDVDATYVYVGGARGSYRLPVDLSTQTQIISGYTQSIRVDSSGNIYCGTNGGIPLSLYKYNSALALQWTEDTNDAFYSIDFDSNEDLIVGTNDNEVRKYLADGTSPNAGTWATVVYGAGIQVRVAVDISDNSVYCTSANDADGTQDRFKKLNSSGVEQWAITTDAGDLERVFIDSSSRVWVVGDDVSTYDTWLVDTTEHTFTDVIVLGADLKDVCGTGVAIKYWRKILTEYMPNEEPHFGDVKLDDRTASRLLATDASKVTTSVTDLTSWVAGTANEIDIADDGDGTITIGIVDPLIVGKGGTGAATLTDHSLLVGSGTDAITALGAATDGQLPIGSTGADPVLAGLTGTANQITVTNGAGSITLSTPQNIHTSATPTFGNLTLSGSETYGIDLSGGTWSNAAINLDANSKIYAGGNEVCSIDGTNQRITITKTSNTYPFTIKSTDGTDEIRFHHDNNNPYIKWTDGDLILMTDEGTDHNTRLFIKGKGSGEGVINVYDEDNSNYFSLTCTAGKGRFEVPTGGAVQLDFQRNAGINVTFFDNSSEGETEEVEISGYRTGDTRRALEIGVGVDAADTASFDGVSNYLFDGDIRLHADNRSIWLGAGYNGRIFYDGSNVVISPRLVGTGGLCIGEGTAGVDYKLIFDGETNDGAVTWMEDEARFDFDSDIKITASAPSIILDDGGTGATTINFNSTNGNWLIQNAGNDNFYIRDDSRGVNVISISQTGAVTLSETLDVTGRFNSNNTDAATTSTNASAIFDGGIGVVKNSYFQEYVSVGQASGAILGKLFAKVNNAEAVPVLTLEQDDLSEQLVHFKSESAADNSQPLVDAADLTTSGSIVGWIKIEITDDAGAGAIADGDYYIPFYSTPTA